MIGRVAPGEFLGRSVRSKCSYTSSVEITSLEGPLETRTRCEPSADPRRGRQGKVRPVGPHDGSRIRIDLHHGEHLWISAYRREDRSVEIAREVDRPLGIVVEAQADDMIVQDFDIGDIQVVAPYLRGSIVPGSSPLLALSQQAASSAECSSTQSATRRPALRGSDPSMTIPVVMEILARCSPYRDVRRWVVLVVQVDGDAVEAEPRHLTRTPNSASRSPAGRPSTGRIDRGPTGCPDRWPSR